MKFIRLQSAFLALGFLMMAGVIANFSAPVAHAQAISGDITGTVTDASKAVVVKATVVAKNVGTGIAYTATTGGAGDYRISNLPPGTYDITASATGFAKSTLKNFAVQLNQVLTANFTLKISANETVEVSAEAGVALDTTTAALETSFSSQQLTELPAATNNVLNLSLMTAGVATSGGVGQGTGPSVGGQRPTDNNYMVEGIDNNDKSVPGPLLAVPSDAVAQFTSMQNQYSAEFGHSNGGQFNQIIKSGTNKFHGVAYEYSQNRHYNAIDAGTARAEVANNQQPSNPRYDDNRFGGQVGGPIFKNKLFFFSNYEQEPQGFPGGVASFCAPTSAGFTTLSGLAGLAANNLAVYKLYSPVASTQAGPKDALCPQTVPVVISGTTTNIPVGDVGFVAGSYTNNKRSINSVDYTPNEKDSLRARYLYNNTGGIDTAATFPAFWATTPSLFHLATLSEFHTFTPNLTSEFRLGYNRFYSTVPAPGTFPGMNVFPNLTFDDLNGINVGPDPNAPQATIQNTYQGSESIMYIKGKHTLKTGFEFRDVISPQVFVQRLRGDYEWSHLGLYLQDLAPDVFGERNATAPGASPTYYGNEKVMYAYIQDDWKVNQKLTVNLGVRYEYTGIPLGEQAQSENSAASVSGLITFGVPQAQKANFVPRIGFAYSLDPKTVVRGGFGMGYDVLYDNLGILAPPPQMQVTEDVGDVGLPQPNSPNFLKNGGLPATQAITSIAEQRALTSGYVPDQRLPYAENFSIGIERTFAQNYTFEARYVGTHGVDLPTQNRLNRQHQAAGLNMLPMDFTGNITQLNSASAKTLAIVESTGSTFVPAYAAGGFGSGNLIGFMPYSSSEYNGLATQLTRRFSHGFLFNAAYTWSKTMDNATATAFSTYLTPRRSLDFRNLQSDWSRSALDHAHRLTFAAVWDIPYFSTSSNWLEKNILGNWEFAPVFTYQSPEFATVQSNVDAWRQGDAAAARSWINPNGIKGTGSASNPIWDPLVAAGSGCQNVTVGGVTTCVGDTVGYTAVNPNAYYIQSGVGAGSDDIRNSLKLFGIRDLDATAMKRLNIYKQTKLEFAAQIWNVLNKSQYVPGALNNINSIGYTGGSVHDMLIPGQTTFNNSSAVFNNNARSMQLALKFIF
ncbi:MAG: TonB-dependent receptor [Terracidiphilus sp.]|jgi:hypothetical protein